MKPVRGDNHVLVELMRVQIWDYPQASIRTELNVVAS